VHAAPAAGFVWFAAILDCADTVAARLGVAVPVDAEPGGDPVDFGSRPSTGRDSGCPVRGSAAGCG